MAVSGAKTPAGSRCSPLASAISTTAVSPRSANAAVTSSPERPGDPYLAALESGRDRGGDGAVAAVGDGQRLDLARRGATRRSPAVTRSATCTAVSEPLNLSAAMSTPSRCPIHCSVRHLAFPLLSGPRTRQGSRAAATLTAGAPASCLARPLTATGPADPRMVGNRSG